MGVSAADYDCDGNLDIVKTNFAGDTSSLYHNLGKMNFDDQTFQAGLGKNTRFLGWGVGFVDFDNDGWPDIFVCNGHVYPEVGETEMESGYRERKVLYRNLGNRKFADVSTQAGPGILEKVPGRGCAFGDFDNDGDVDVLVNCINDVPQLLRCDQSSKTNWLKVKTRRREIESFRHRRAASTASPRTDIARWTKSAAAAATFHRAICAFTLAWAVTLGRNWKSSGPAGRSIV